jgi:polyketide synthase 5
MLSPKGRCHAFDVRADGFVRAEGCGVVMLKRLSDAMRDKDRVLAVIRGSAINQDGRTQNILAPSRTAQISVIERALAEAQVDPASIGMVEAHGTGTPVGDTTEFQSLSTQYGRHAPCALGSLKSNLGHAESAAGVLGLIKATLALSHGVVPRSLHFQQLPAHLQTIETQLSRFGLRHVRHECTCRARTGARAACSDPSTSARRCARTGAAVPALCHFAASASRIGRSPCILAGCKRCQPKPR